jgi:hypothetical protein
LFPVTYALLDTDIFPSSPLKHPQLCPPLRERSNFTPVWTASHLPLYIRVFSYVQRRLHLASRQVWVCIYLLVGWLVGDISS